MFFARFWLAYAVSPSDEALDAITAIIGKTDWTERTETVRMTGPPEQQEMLIEAQAIMLRISGEKNRN